MTKRTNVIIGEWLFTLTSPSGGRRGRVRVSVENAEALDLAFSRTLARLAEVWLNATRKARR